MGLPVKGVFHCPICGHPVPNQDGHRLTLEYYGPKNWWGIRHYVPDDKEKGKEKQWCSKFGYSFEEAVALITSKFVKTEEK